MYHLIETGQATDETIETLAVWGKAMREKRDRAASTEDIASGSGSGRTSPSTSEAVTSQMHNVGHGKHTIPMLPPKRTRQSPKSQTTLKSATSECSLASSNDEYIDELEDSDESDIDIAPGSSAGMVVTEEDRLEPGSENQDGADLGSVEKQGMGSPTPLKRKHMSHEASSKTNADVKRRKTSETKIAKSPITSSRLYVSGVKTLSIKDLMDYFSDYGEIQEIHKKPGHNVAFVDYGCVISEDVQKKLVGKKVIKSVPVDVQSDQKVTIIS